MKAGVVPKKLGRGTWRDPVQNWLGKSISFRNPTPPRMPFTGSTSVYRRVTRSGAWRVTGQSASLSHLGDASPLSTPMDGTVGP